MSVRPELCGRLAGAVTLGLLLAGGLSACGGDDGAAGADDTKTTQSAGVDPAGCVGEPGEETLLQGQPHDFPDGSGAGIGSVDMDADPPAVRLVLGDVPADQRDQDTELTVGDLIDIGDTTWTVTRICSSEVDLIAR